MSVEGILTNDTLLSSRGYGESVDDPVETWKVWLWAFGFVTIINLSSIMGIIFFPLMNKWFYTIVMRTMIGLAIGSLSGSALFHLIPGAFGFEASDPERGAHHYINISFVVWLAAWIVMILECAIKIGVKVRAKSRRKRNRSNNDKLRTIEEQNEADKKPLDPYPNNVSNGTPKGPTLDVDMNDENSHELSINLSKSREQMPVYRSTLSLSKTLAGMQSEVGTEDSQSDDQIKTVAWIIIIGDSLHNFIDGISIGTSFVKSFHTGAIISIAIMCEEFPHELGDFAILINSGLSVKKALLFNFLSALTCYLGMALGILLGKIEWESYIFAFAAGIFLYVALADMVPEVTSLIDEVSDISPKGAVKVLLNHNLGILTGVTILYVLALYQPE